MTNDFLLSLEELVYGERDHNLRITDIKCQDERGEFYNYKGNFLVTKKGYLLKGADSRLNSEKGILFFNEGITLQHENNRMSYVIRRLGKLKLVEMSPITQTKKLTRLCFV